MGWVRVPFTAEQVESLNGFQACGAFQEVTCGNDLCPGEQPALIAGEDGWSCPSCPYAQDWAHDMMADGTWRDFQHMTIAVDGEPAAGKWTIHGMPGEESA